MAARRIRTLALDDWAETVRLLLAAGTRVEVVAEPLASPMGRTWGLLALVEGKEGVALGRAREFKKERKVWRRFEALCAYLDREVPGLSEVRVRLKESRP